MLERILYWFGYLFAHILFLGTNTPQGVVRRLRLAYRLVGVRIIKTPTINETERTIFLCPYRNLATGWFGQKWMCHEKLDRVDDGYVMYLRRYKDIDYQRPRSCDTLADGDKSEYCYSEISQW